MLTAYRLDVVTEAITPVALGRYCGSTLRGVFFRAIWGRFCTNRESPECRVCPLVAACPVASLVAPLRDEAAYGHDVPRSYVISPPRNEENHYKPGETFTFSLTLMGTSAKLFPYVIRSFQEMEHIRLGHPSSDLQGRKGQIKIREVYAHHPLTKEKQLLWEAGSTRPQHPRLCVTSDDIAKHAKQLPADHIILNFLSPTRLIADHNYLKRPDFRVLMLRLTERLERLQREYSEYAESRDSANEKTISSRELYLEIGTQAAKVRLSQDETQWVDVKSYSARQHRATPIGGFMGRAAFEGDLTHLRELLTWGEVLYVGKNTVKGDGQYCIEM